MPELTELDRERARAWCERNGKEPTPGEAPFGWTYAECEKSNLPYWVYRAAGVEGFDTRDAAMDALAVVLRDLRALLGVDAEIEEAVKGQKERDAERCQLEGEFRKQRGDQNDDQIQHHKAITAFALAAAIRNQP
jgi:hypothetical protein